MLHKIYLFNKLNPTAYSLINLTLEEIFEALAEVEEDPYALWRNFHIAYGKDYFITIIEREYGKRFAKDYEKIYSDIEDVKKEAQSFFETIAKQSGDEILLLKQVVDEKTLEIQELRERMAAEAENARKDAYLQAENEFEAKLAKGNPS